MMTTNVVPLGQATDPSRFGRKATTLALLSRAGLPVPDGFALSADLVEEQITATIPHLVAALEHCAPYGLIARSSATCEDGERSSFAGLYTSRFCPTDPASLQHAVQDVRASVGSEVARAYATTRNIENPSQMAVVVQPAVRPYAAGVLGVERRSRRWRIEAIRGLAEPLASGAQTGEFHCSDGRTIPAQQTEVTLPGTTEELQLMPGEWIHLLLPEGSAQRAKIRTSASGLLRLYPPEPRQVLDGRQEARLLDLAITAARCLNLDNVDVEWALLPDGTIHLLQARPLTSRLPTPPAVDQHAPKQGWQGISASPGEGAGPLVHLSELPQGTIKDHVLVCGNIGADAAAALLQEPAAIVTTCGGTLSHAAITARELGIPCVTGVPETINAVPAGTNVTVNGLTGIVLPILTERSGIVRPPKPQRRPFTNTTRTAVVTPHPTPEAADGFLTMLVLHLPGVAVNARDLSRSTPTPTGLFQPTEAPTLSPLPTGYTEHHLPGLGRLAWPDDVGPLPDQFIVLDGSRIIYRRPLTTEPAR